MRRLTSSWEGIRASAVHHLAPQSPGASPRPCRNLPLKSVLRHFLQCGMQKIDSSIHSVTKYFFLRIQSLPDTVLCWVCSREQGEVSGPLQGATAPGCAGYCNGECRIAAQEHREWGMREVVVGAPWSKRHIISWVEKNERHIYETLGICQTCSSSYNE